MNSAHAQAPIRLGIVILGAGASSRMGRPKLLLPWGDTSVIGHLLEQCHAVDAEQIVVVCTRDNVALQRELDVWEFPSNNRVINPAPERGMFSSIQCAARWTGWQPGLTHWAISLGDQPLVSTETLQALLDFTADHPNCICQPSRNKRAKHPVIFPADEFGKLASTTEPHLKEFLHNRDTKRALLESHDTGLDLDLDEPADYERALRLMPELLATR